MPREIPRSLFFGSSSHSHGPSATSPSHSAVSVEFLPISVLRRSTLIFPKIPRGSRRFFFLISPPYLYCVFTRLSTVFFFFVLLRSLSFFSQFLFSPSAIVLLPPAWFLLLPPPCPVSPRIYSSLMTSLSSRSSLASSFFPRQPGDLRRFLRRATSSLYAPVEDPDER